MNQKHRTWAERWQTLTRNHPLVYFLLLLATAFLTGPLMIAANNMSAVLYQDF